MTLSRELALTILGLPNFATSSDIVIRYKHLAITWYPEANSNYNSASQAFKFYTIAAHSLLFPDRCVPVNLNLIDMYGFFQYIFFGSSEIEVDKSDESDDDRTSSTTGANGESTEDKAASTALELIEEEEREKNKAEKRKAKKKRRKEKKKLEKIAEKEVPVVEKSSAPEEKPEDPKSESEEDFDASSAFVSVIAKKHKVPGFQSANENAVPTLAVNGIPKEDPQSVILRSRQLALRGNEMASMEHFNEAIQLFSEAINLDSSDFRFYGNRSYCYEMLQQHEKALKDAEKSLEKSPTWAKGHFRKGRALMGLKKYALAEQSFLEVLKYDEGCEFAISELHHARVSQLVEKGYTKEKAAAAILKHGSVPEALKNLKNAKGDNDIFMSDEESDPVWISKSIPTVPVKSVKKPPVYDIKEDPNNPEGHKSIWVGNVQTDVTEKKLLSMFSKFGEIVSIKLDSEKFYAFINYANKSAPGKAMRTYQGFELSSGYHLAIRFPNQGGEVAQKPAVKKKGKR